MNSEYTNIMIHKNLFPRKSWYRRQTFFGLMVIVLALLIAFVSFVILVGLTSVVPDRSVTVTLIGINVAMVLCLIFIITREIYPIIRAWRARRAASRLHVRIVTLFSLVAAFPALVVAAVAAITFNLGLDRWFDTNTRQIVASSTDLANAYAGTTLQSLQTASITMSMQLDNRQLLVLDPAEYRRQITLQAIGRGLLGVFLLRRDGSVIISSNRGGEGELPIPPQSWIEETTPVNPVQFQPGAHDYFGVILKMNDIDDAWLYAVQEIDSRVLDALRLTEINVNHYRRLEANRVPAQIAFGVLYLCLFLIMLLSAIWAAIAVADRLVRPIRLLISAADDVASGNMDVSVPVHARDGDVGQLSGTFNYMVEQLKSQRNALIAASNQIDERRRFSEAVLSGVTAAVIGVDDAGCITILNRSAEAMFGFDLKTIIGKPLVAVNAEIGDVLGIAAASGKTHREQITITRRGHAHVYNVQITMEDAGEKSPWVVTVDDITDLIEAQRSSAWADVARRIAHEIKNPLTPIQLSAERIRRRYEKNITGDRRVFEKCIDTIIRQVGSIGRMVDEFSSFARMPRPEVKLIDVREPLREALFLVEVSRQDITFELDAGDQPLVSAFDSRLIGQAFGNVIKNASEAIDAVGGREGYRGHILVQAAQEGSNLVVDVIDNGRGLPEKQRQRLLEPYITMREKGTGLGLAIVRKIVEEHGGYMGLLDAPPDFFNGQGAMIRMVFPMLGNRGSLKLLSATAGA